jgi:AcrR family transcriptional regulator
MPTRMRRVEQVERNRERVLAAAQRVFIDRGYAGATLEAIADEAGFSKGVVYSQFGSKPDLFFALLEQRSEQRAAHHRQAVAGRTGLDAFQALVRAGDEDAASEPGWGFVLTEFRAQAVRDPHLNGRYSALHFRTVDNLAKVLTGIHESAGVTPAIPARSLAEFLLATATGVALERSANSSALPEQVIAEFLFPALGFIQSATSERPKEDG